MHAYADTYIDHIRHHAIPVTGSIRDYDRLMRRIGDARFVLIGEASHGTHEFYEQRAEITKRLIREKGFTAVAVEADWPDAYRINRFVQGQSEDQNAKEDLMNFQCFPTWMWRNTVMLDFIGWLRNHNDGLASHTPKTGFYGLDLYSLTDQKVLTSAKALGLPSAAASIAELVRNRREFVRLAAALVRLEFEFKRDDPRIRILAA